MSMKTCERCQGNGEIVTDLERYQHPQEGDKGDEAVAECPDCGGEGIIDASDGWQPIETAPKDGTPVLCVCMKTLPGSEEYLGKMAVDSWKARYNGFGQFNTSSWPATHWMPLPDLPGGIPS